MPQRQLKNLSR